MNQQQLVNRVVSAAIWQLMRRAPTWLLILIVGGAFLFAFASHGEEMACDFEHQCYHMDLAHPDRVTPPPAGQYPKATPAPIAPQPAPSAEVPEQTPLATAPTPLTLAPGSLDAESCYWLRRSLFHTTAEVMAARRACGDY